MALTSLAKKFSPLPMPSTSGLPRRAPMSTSGKIIVDEHDAVSADHLFQRRAQRLQQPALGRLASRGIVELPDEMRQHLRVGLRMKDMAFADELVFQRRVVFDDAIMAEKQLSALIRVRMRVGVGHSAMRGPARVGNARRPGGRGLLDQFRQIGDAPDPFAGLDLPVVHDRHSGAVIAAIFQPPQPVQENGNGLGIADVADDAAHINGLWIADYGWRIEDAVADGSQTYGVFSVSAVRRRFRNCGGRVRSVEEWFQNPARREPEADVLWDFRDVFRRSQRGFGRQRLDGLGILPRIRVWLVTSHSLLRLAGRGCA